LRYFNIAGFHQLKCGEDAAMARLIKSIIELNKKQTLEFLASLRNPKNEKNRLKSLREAKRTKFNVIL